MRRRVVTVTAEEHRVLLRGWRVGDLLLDGGFRPTYAGTVRSWALDRHRLADVVAYLECRRVDVRVVEAGEAA